MNPNYTLRLLETPLTTALEDTPVVLIHGPRQCGKTTLAQKVGQKLGYDYLTFDDDSLLDAVRADPVGFVDNLGKRVILDEIQHAPELFKAIKASVDRNRIPGRFLLTGSTNVLLLPKLSDSLAGRMEIMNLRPLAQCEIQSRENNQKNDHDKGLLCSLLEDQTKLDCDGKLGHRLGEILVAGGYPEAIQRTSERRRKQWYSNYIDTLVQRDVRELARISNLDAVPKILQLAAEQSAQLLNMSELAAPFQITRQTVSTYFTLLRSIFLIDVLPAWHSNRAKRLIKTPKVHISDSGLAANLMGISSKLLNNDRTLLGHLTESYVYNELQRQGTWVEEDLKVFSLSGQRSI